MKTSHHPPDRTARSRRAEQIGDASQKLLAQGKIAPAQLVLAPTLLAQRDYPATHTTKKDFSQGVAMAEQDPVGVLIFGSSAKPGGGWRNGAKAQEEDISLASTWGVQAEEAQPGFYLRRPGLGGMGPDKALIAKGLWLTDTRGVPLETPRRVVFAGIAAPNLNNPEALDVPLAKRIDHLARRLAGCLLAWQKEGVETVVLGAIGCGVFAWNGYDSALALRKAVNHAHAEGYQPKIAMAMPDDRLAAIFSEVLNDQPGMHKTNDKIELRKKQQSSQKQQADTARQPRP